MKTPFVFQTVVGPVLNSYGCRVWCLVHAFKRTKMKYASFAMCLGMSFSGKYEHVDGAWCMLIDITTRKKENHIELLIVFFEIDG